MNAARPAYEPQDLPGVCRDHDESWEDAVGELAIAFADVRREFAELRRAIRQIWWKFGLMLLVQTAVIVGLIKLI